jgi:hypothetical protein
VPLVEREAPALRLHERAEQDRDLREAGRVDHRVAVEHREVGPARRREVDEGEGEAARGHGPRQPLRLHDRPQALLQRGVFARSQLAGCLGKGGILTGGETPSRDRRQNEGGQEHRREHPTNEHQTILKARPG